MLDFLIDAFNYESRKVARFDAGDMFIDTCLVRDGDHPYETAVMHPAFNDGKIIIVEVYDTIDEAKAGHARWVNAMTQNGLPDFLVEVLNSDISKLAFDGPTVFYRIP